MDERVRRLAEQLLDTGFDKLSERERRVITRVAERSQISRDVNSAFDEKQTFGDRLADRVARFGGSWTFIILFLSTLVAWAVLNSVTHSASGILTTLRGSGPAWTRSMHHAEGTGHGAGGITNSS